MFIVSGRYIRVGGPFLADGVLSWKQSAFEDKRKQVSSALNQYTEKMEWLSQYTEAVVQYISWKWSAHLFCSSGYPRIGELFDTSHVAVLSLARLLVCLESDCSRQLDIFSKTRAYIMHGNIHLVAWILKWQPRILRDVVPCCQLEWYSKAAS